MGGPGGGGAAGSRLTDPGSSRRAAGFTGTLAAEYFAERASRPGGGAGGPLRVGLAGRSAAKLEALQQRLAAEYGGEFDVLVADTADPASLRAMAAAAHVVLSFVGPYVRYGVPVAEACFAAGAHLVDITGEAKYQKVVAPSPAPPPPRRRRRPRPSRAAG